MLVAAAVTTGPAGSDAGVARAVTEGAVLRAVAGGAGLIVLPELFALPYAAADEPARWRHLAEPVDGPTAQWASRLAQETGAVIVFGAAIGDGEDLPANAAIAVLPDGAIRMLAEKINLPPKDGHSYGEADHFRPGKMPPATVKVGGVNIGAIVCYDRRYPECWRRLLAAGADLIAVLVAGPAPADPDGIYEAELRTHARANAIFVATAARTGIETVTGRPVRHDGRTIAIDSDGRVREIAEAAPGAIAWLTISDDALRAARAARASRTSGMNRYDRAKGGEHHE